MFLIGCPGFTAIQQGQDDNSLEDEMFSLVPEFMISKYIISETSEGRAGRFYLVFNIIIYVYVLGKVTIQVGEMLNVL